MPLIARLVTTDPALHEAMGAKNIEHLRRHLEECRNGDFSGFSCLRTALTLKLATLEEIGTSDEEMQRLYETGILAPDLARAKEVLAKARNGDLGEFKELADLLEKGTVGLDDLDMKTEELDGLVEQYNLFTAKRTVKECRSGDYSGFENLEQGIARGLFDFEEVGTTREEFVQFRKDRYIVPARRCLEEAKAGNFENIKELQQLVNSRRVTSDELGISQEELTEVLRPYYVQEALSILSDCRDGNIVDLDGLRALIEQVPLTYDELGTSEEEVAGFGRGQALDELREIADECRRGNYTNLPLLIMAVELLPSSGNLTPADIDSLDLELDVWRRRDEVDQAHELLKALRDRGGLSEADEIDRQLLTRFTAEELGLSEEEFLVLITPKTLH